MTKARIDPRPRSPAPAPSLSERGGYRRSALGALAAEVGHELQGPVNLFRLTHERLVRGATLDEEDLSLLDEELRRLSRLTGRLRDLAQTAFAPRALSPRELVEAALTCAPLPIDPGELEIDLGSEPSAHVTCDRESLGRALRELIDNALEARATRAGVRFVASAEAGFCVWDDGPGLALDVERAMTWGVTTRPAAAGIGLTLALRGARAHGFGIELRRRPPLTEAWLLVPPRAIRAHTPELEP